MIIKRNIVNLYHITKLEYVNDILKRENYGKGVIISNKNSLVSVDLYLILSYGVKISEVVYEVQKRVKYVLESTLDVSVESVNVYVQGLKNIE